MKNVIVLAVHGSYGTRFFLEPIVSFLLKKGVYADAITLPWHTESFATQKQQLKKITLSDYVSYVEKAIQKHTLQHPEKKIILIGHSMGTTIIDSLVRKEPEKYSGAIYLAPTAGLSIWGLIKLIMHYDVSTQLTSLFGRPHIIPFYAAKKTMMNETNPGEAGAIYKNMTYESGKVLRETLFYRRNFKNLIPKIEIFGKDDKTIIPKKAPNAIVVKGDHISMLKYSKNPIFDFIQSLSG